MGMTDLGCMRMDNIEKDNETERMRLIHEISKIIRSTTSTDNQTLPTDNHQKIIPRSTEETSDLISE